MDNEPFDPSKWVETYDGWNTERHYEERKTQGFSKADWINFDTYIAWVISNAVKKMKAEGHTMFSFPGEPEDKWEELTYKEYDIMINGFGRWAEDNYVTYEPGDFAKLSDDLDAALDIFKKRFKSLWD